MFLICRFHPKRWLTVLSVVAIILSSLPFLMAADSGEHKAIYLTFDDGPSYVTPRLLEVLKKHNVKATFFVTGQYPEYFHILKQISDDGHVIALHSYSHKFKEIYSSTSAFWEDINKLDDMIFEITEQRAQKIIRFAGGSSNTISYKYGGYEIMDILVQECVDKGYAYCDWTIDTRDAVGGTVAASTLCARVVGKVDEVPVAVVLMHDGPDQKTVADAVESIITSLKDNGYIFDTLDHLTEAVHHTMP